MLRDRLATHNRALNSVETFEIKKVWIPTLPTCNYLKHRSSLYILLWCSFKTWRWGKFCIQKCLQCWSHISFIGEC
jgi:hypothetical protein